MSLPPGILAKVDGRLRGELRKQDEGLTARVSVSKEQWAIWKRYCDMVGVSAGGGLAVLVDHELASIVDKDIESLTESVKSREAGLVAREADLADREEAVARQERSCDWREEQIERTQARLDERGRRLDARREALELFAKATNRGHRTDPKPNLVATSSAGATRRRSTRTAISSGTNPEKVS